MNINEIISLYKGCLDPVTQRLQSSSPPLNIKMLVIYEEIKALQKNPTSPNYQTLQQAVQNGDINDRAVIDWIESNEQSLAQAHKNLRALQELAFAETQQPPDQKIFLRAQGSLSNGQVKTLEVKALRSLNLHKSEAAKRIKLPIDEKATAQLVEEAIQDILAGITAEIVTTREKALGSSYIVDDARGELQQLLGAGAITPIVTTAVEAAIKTHPRARVIGVALIAAGLAAAKASADGHSAIAITAAGQGAAAIRASGGDPGQAKFAGETIAIMANTIATTYANHPNEINIINIAVQAASKALQDHAIGNPKNLSPTQLQIIATHAGKTAAKIVAGGEAEKSALAGGSAAAIESIETASTDESILAVGTAAAAAFNAGGDQAKHASAAGAAAGAAFRKARADGRSPQAAQKAAESAGIAVSKGRKTAVEESTAAAQAYDTHHSDIATFAATMVAADYPADLALQIEAATVAASAEQAGRQQTAHLEGVVAAIVGKNYPGNNDAKTAAINAAIAAANAGRQNTLTKEAMTAAEVTKTYPNNPAAITAAVTATVAYQNEPEQMAASMAAAAAVVAHPAAHAGDIGSIAAAQRITLGNLAKSAREDLTKVEEAEKLLAEEKDKHEKVIKEKEAAIKKPQDGKALYLDANGQPLNKAAERQIAILDGQINAILPNLHKTQEAFSKAEKALKAANSETKRKKLKVDNLNTQIATATIASVSAAEQALTAGRSIPEATLDALATGIAEVIAPNKTDVADAARLAANKHRLHPSLNKLIEITAKTANDAVTKKRATASLEAAAAAEAFAKHHADSAVDFIVDEAIKAVQRSSHNPDQNTVLQVAEAATTAAASMSSDFLKAQNAINEADKAESQPGQRANATQTQNRTDGQTLILQMKKITEIAAKIALQYAHDPKVIAITAVAVATARKHPDSPLIAALAAAETTAAYPSDPMLATAAEIAAVTAKTYSNAGSSEVDALAYARKIGAALCTPLPTLANAVSASVSASVPASSTGIGASLPAGSIAITQQQYQQTQDEIRDAQDKAQQTALALAAQIQRTRMAEQQAKEALEREAQARLDAQAAHAREEDAKKRLPAAGGGGLTAAQIAAQRKAEQKKKAGLK